GIYNTAVTAIENADDEQTINSANNNALAEIIALISGGTSNSAINVTVAVEKFTIDGAYIVVPTQVTLPTGATAGQALEVALALAFPDAEIPLFHNGSSGPGYAGGIYDPSYAGNPDFTGSYYADYLSEKNEGAGSGWQYAVNNDFPNISAWAQTLESGDVVRWQYTLSLGNDLKNLANKDALTWKIAELRAAGKSYSGALTAATKLNASQSEVNAAFLALYGIAPPVQTSAGYGGAVTPAEGGAYTVAATSEGYVIDEIWVDGVKLTDVQGLSEVTVTPSSSVFATFAYTINFPNPANGTLSVSRGATSLKSGDIVSAGEILTITSSVTLKLSGLTLVEGDDYRVVAPQNAPPTIEVSNLTIDENGDCTITAENNSALLPKSLLSEIGEGKTLTVDAELGKLTFNYAALAALAALNGDEVSVTIEAAAPLDSRPVFSLKINGGDVSSFGAGGSVSVKLPYTQVGDEILANKKVYNVVGTALSRIAGSGYYDGFVTFDTSHFSDYLIGDVVKGDTNGNALVDANDAMLVGRAAAGLDTLTEEVTGICDMNGNGVIDANDAMLIGRLAAHLD
ncbi:MAG: DUF4430 domain-containing protein, partial [Oscillospiraceae bacterium]|nr:DUF4430 domain-containing protein [Oscillospiraceae bacterium]